MGAIDSAIPVDDFDDDNSAGYRLRCARERSGLSIRDAASALNLMVSHVRAIEADRYITLNNDKQFLRHLHDFANLVDLDPNDVEDIYRSQQKAIARRVAAQSAENNKPSHGKWYAVGVLAVACAGLGIWSLTQTPPDEPKSNTAKMSDEVTAEKLSKAAPVAGNKQAAVADTVATAKPAADLPARAANSVSVPAPVVIASREATTIPDEENNPPVKEIAARSDQAALETSQEPPRQRTVNIAPVNTTPGKNALLSIGAKPLKTTLIELKDTGTKQAKRS